MSKYSHYEMCEKIFGERFKWDEKEKTYKVYSRTDMWDKLIEQQKHIADLEEKLVNMVRKYELASLPMGGLIDTARNLERQLAENESEHEQLINTFEEETEELRKQIKRESDARKRFVEEVKKLKLQVVDKEQSIEVLKQRLKDTVKIYSDDFVEKDKELKELRFKARNIFPLVENLEDKVNQDKISFCIDNFEKVKAELVNEVSPVNLTYTEYVQEVFNKLNSKIEELKKEMMKSE